MKTIGVRDFLRGAYKDTTEPVLVMNHSTPIAVWQPYDQWKDEEQKTWAFNTAPGGVIYGNSSRNFGTFTASGPWKKKGK